MVENKRMKAGLVQELEQMPESVYPLDSELKSWNETSWNHIDEWHKPLVDRTLETDDRVNHITKEYNRDIVQRIKDDCIDGLKNLVINLRAEHFAEAKPKDCNWTKIILNPERYLPIQQILLLDKKLQEAMGTQAMHESYNIAMAVSNKYAALVNDINNYSAESCRGQ